MNNIPDERSKQAALSHILQVVSSKLGKGVMYTAAVLGMASLIPGLELPGTLSVLATGIGVEAIGAIIERVANGNASDDEIKQQVELALKQNNIDRLLTKDEFWHAYAQLREGQRSLSDKIEVVIKHLQGLESQEASDVAVVDGTHRAEGIGEVTGIDAQGPVIFKPGTKSSARGIGKITATRIGGEKELDE